MKVKLHCQLRLARWLLLLIALCAQTALAQTTAFTYQGRLTDGGNPANGNYDLQFALFDNLSGGAQIGSTLTRSSVAVSGGVFTVQLDFGVSAFPGANRFLEIGVRPANVGNFTTLSPRQQVSSTPYAIRTLSAATADTATNATQLGGIAASQYVQTNDSRLSDSRPPTPGSSNYIQNTTPGAGTNFSISGNGIAAGTFSSNVVNATTQYNIGGNRVLSNPGTNNLFAGIGAGQANSTGCCSTFFGFNSGAASNANDNSFFGNNAGAANTTGSSNSFFGSAVGLSNTIGSNNSFFGVSAGRSNTQGFFNTFLGYQAGRANTIQHENTFIGNNAGVNNGTNDTNGFANYNTFVGNAAGLSNTLQHDNTFIGNLAGRNNGTNDPGGNANFNTFVGSVAGFSNTNGQRNSFFGYNAGNANSDGTNNSFYGSEAGVRNTTGSTNSFFGNAAGFFNTAGNDNSFFGNDAGLRTTSDNNSFFGSSAGFNNSSGYNNAFFGYQSGVASTSGAYNNFFGANAGINNTTGIANSVFGSDAGSGNSTGSENSFFGDSAGVRTTADSNSFFGFYAGFANVNGRSNTAIGWFADVASGALDHATAIGAETIAPASNQVQIGRNSIDKVSIGLLGSDASTPICMANSIFSTCSSSRRYKENINSFSGSLSLLQRLRPVTFDWKSRKEHDLGLIAEEVFAVDPLLITHNDKGEIEGVKYDKLTVVLINAVKEQQRQIETLRAQNTALSARLQGVEKALRKKVGSTRRRR